MGSTRVKMAANRAIAKSKLLLTDNLKENVHFPDVFLW